LNCHRFSCGDCFRSIAQDSPIWPTSTAHTHLQQLPGKVSAVSPSLPFNDVALTGLPTSGNIMGFAFPLFTEQMLDKLGYNWSNTVFAILAVVMAPVPAVGPLLLFILSALTVGVRCCSFTVHKFELGANSPHLMCKRTLEAGLE
jgi:hypothetical protein